jgi:4-hydroxy-tetrahydrodipicolinate reductase
MSMKIGIAGATGRMGRILVEAVAGSPDAVLAGASVRPGSDHEGRDIGEIAGLGTLGVAATSDREALFAAADVVIDFTAPELTMAHLELATATATALVIGTTGMDADQRAAMAAAAERVAIVYGANMSLGVNLLLGLTRRVAAALDEDFDIEIVEMHHRHKKDAPSGTALALAEAAAAGRAVALDEVAERGRDGLTGERRRGAIGLAALRGGDIVGEHTVIFAGAGERLEIGHRATSRAIYGTGAVKAALWLKGRPPGLYGMADVLGLT